MLPPHGLHILEALRLDGLADGIGMDGQLTGNGADLPMFGVKIAANLGAGFRTSRQQDSPSFWNAWKRIDEASQSTADLSMIAPSLQASLMTSVGAAPLLRPRLVGAVGTAIAMPAVHDAQMKNTA
jgi:hypothetical protein